MSKNDPRKALGKGLHSLLPQRPAPVAEAAPAPAPEPPPEGSVFIVPIGQVAPNPNQPRREFDQAALLELAQSIEREGVIQPILVRRDGSDRYMIIAGERRWRAAGVAGLKEVPVIPREATDEQVLELAIVENIQREDLNPIELAQAFQRMASELSLSHEQIGERTGKDRATVTNTLRLLQLPDKVRDMVVAKKLTQGHARALLKLPTPEIQGLLADQIVRQGWSVRQIENYTKFADDKPAGPVKTPAPPTPVDPNVKAAVVQMEQALGTRVRIVEKARGTPGKGGGLIEIEYYTEDDLERIYDIIVGEQSE